MSSSSSSRSASASALRLPSADEVTANALFDLFVARPRTSDDIHASYEKLSEVIDNLEKSGVSRGLTKALFARATKAWQETAAATSDQASPPVSVETTRTTKRGIEDDIENGLTRPKRVKNAGVQQEVIKIESEDEGASINRAGETTINEAHQSPQVESDRPKEPEDTVQEYLSKLSFTKMTVNEVFGTTMKLDDNSFEATLVNEANRKRSMFYATDRQIAAIVSNTSIEGSQVKQMRIIESNNRQILHALRYCNSQQSLDAAKDLVHEAIRVGGFRAEPIFLNRVRREAIRTRDADKTLMVFKLLFGLYMSPASERWSAIVNAYDGCMLVHWFDGIVASAGEVRSPVAYCLGQYIKERGVPRGEEERIVDLVTTILACKIAGLAGKARANGQTRVIEETITAAIQNARPLQQFSRAAGGVGIFCLLEENFAEKIRGTSLELRQDYVAAVVARAVDFRVYVRTVTEDLLPNILSRSEEATETLRRLSFVDVKEKGFPSLVSQLQLS